MKLKFISVPKAVDVDKQLFRISMALGDVSTNFIKDSKELTWNLYKGESIGKFTLEMNEQTGKLIEVPQIERKLRIIKGDDEPMVKGEEIAKSAEELVKLLREDAKVI